MICDDPDSCLNASVYMGQTASRDKSNLLVPIALREPGAAPSMSTLRRATSQGAKRLFIVVGDSGYPDEKQFFTVLDNLIQKHRIPSIVAILIGAGGQYVQASERRFEYDAVNGAYAELVEKCYRWPRTTPTSSESRGAGDDGHQLKRVGDVHDGQVPPRVYHLVLTYSPTVVNQQWPHIQRCRAARGSITERGGTAGRGSKRRGKQSCEERYVLPCAVDPQ